MQYPKVKIIVFQYTEKKFKLYIQAKVLKKEKKIFWGVYNKKYAETVAEQILLFFGEDKAEIVWDTQLKIKTIK